MWTEESFIWRPDGRPDCSRRPDGRPNFHILVAVGIWSSIWSPIWSPEHLVVDLVVVDAVTSSNVWIYCILIWKIIFNENKTMVICFHFKISKCHYVGIFMSERAATFCIKACQHENVIFICWIKCILTSHRQFVCVWLFYKAHVFQKAQVI